MASTIDDILAKRKRDELSKILREGKKTSDIVETKLIATMKDRLKNPLCKLQYR